MLRTPIFSVALVLVVAALLLTSLFVSAALTAFATFTATLPGAVLVAASVQVVLNLAVLTGLFALLFRCVPRTQVAWRDVWLGAGLTAFSWTVLQYAIAYSIALSNYQDYGTIGAILALVAWVFLSSQVVFLGAVAPGALPSRQHCGRSRPEAWGSPSVSWSPSSHSEGRSSSGYAASCAGCGGTRLDHGLDVAHGSAPVAGGTLTVESPRGEGVTNYALAPTIDRH